MKALVVFHGFGQGWFAKLGRPGFRHCFLVVAHQGAWLRLDVMNGAPTMEMVCAESFDLAAFYRAAGLTVVEAETRAEPFRSWLMLGTCVGILKRALGLRAPLTITPHQLYRRLKAA